MGRNPAEFAKRDATAAIRSGRGVVERKGKLMIGSIGGGM